jgi:hypothetical protein
MLARPRLAPLIPSNSYHRVRQRRSVLSNVFTGKKRNAPEPQPEAWQGRPAPIHRGPGRERHGQDASANYQNVKAHTFPWRG